MKINQTTGGINPSPVHVPSGHSKKASADNTTTSGGNSPQQALGNQTPLKDNTTLQPKNSGSRVTLSGKKNEQVNQAMLNQANQRLQMVQKKVKMLQKQIQAVSEHHGRAMMEQLKLLTTELKQAVTLFKRAYGTRSSAPNLSFGKPGGPQFNGSGDKVAGQSSGGTGGLSNLAGGSAEKNSFQETLTKVKGDMKALIRMARATLKDDDERKDADKQLKKVDDIKLEEENVSQQQLNLSLKISDAIGANVQLDVSVETSSAE